MNKSSDSDYFLTKAIQEAGAIAGLRTQTTLGIRYPSPDLLNPGRKRTYGYNLYDGAAGVGLLFHDIAQATEESAWADLASEISAGLASASRARKNLARGLFTGFDGVALFHLIRARDLQDEKELKHAYALAMRLAEEPLCDADLLAGAAGQGLVQIAFYQATKMQVFLHQAKQVANHLEAAAIKTDGGITWKVDQPEEGHQTGLAHGTAGQVLFLSELTQISDDSRLHQLRDDAVAWLDFQAVQETKTSMRWPTNVVGRKRFRHHWCHGTTGISQAYLSHYRATNNRGSFEKAIAAANWTWKKHIAAKNDQISLCHGKAGSIEIFLDLHQAGAGPEWLDRATRIATEICCSEWLLNGKNGLLPDQNVNGIGTGLMLGTAGMTRQLLRLSGKNVNPILQWTDNRNLSQDFLIHSSHESKTEIPRQITKHSSKTLNDKDLLRKHSEAIPYLTASILSDQNERLKEKSRRSRVPGRVDREVIIGPADQTSLAIAINAIHESPASRAIQASIKKIEKACKRWLHSYQSILSDQAITTRSFGILLREISGIVLAHKGNPNRIEQSADKMINQAISSIQIMLDRLVVDREACLKGVISGKLQMVIIQGNDQHRNGERVVALSFDEGPALLYKPRSLRIDKELAGAAVGSEAPTLAELARKWLVPSIENGCLPIHRIIDAGPEHGYAERVQNKAMEVPKHVCAEYCLGQNLSTLRPKTAILKRGDERRYWYSAGLMAGFAFSLGIQDLHLENVICGTSSFTKYTCLHAVDLEMAFGLVNNLNDTSLTSYQLGITTDGSRNHSHAGLDICLDPQCGIGAEEWTIHIDPELGSPRVAARKAVSWTYPHLAMNSSGTFGPDQEIGTFLRGMADQWWSLQRHRKKIERHLRSKLTGARVRVLAKNTQSYHFSIEQEKTGNNHTDDPEYGPEWPHGLELDPSELMQIENLDYPYFFQFLNDQTGEATQTLCIDKTEANGHQKRTEQSKLDRIHAPFWSIVKRQNKRRFAAALLDAGRQLAPAHPFDFHDKDLGIRVMRLSQGDLIIGIVIGERQKRRMICRAFADNQTGFSLE